MGCPFLLMLYAIAGKLYAIAGNVGTTDQNHLPDEGLDHRRDVISFPCDHTTFWMQIDRILYYF